MRDQKRWILAAVCILQITKCISGDGSSESVHLLTENVVTTTEYVADLKVIKDEIAANFEEVDFVNLMISSGDGMPVVIDVPRGTAVVEFVKENDVEQKIAVNKDIEESILSSSTKNFQLDTKKMIDISDSKAVFVTVEDAITTISTVSHDDYKLKTYTENIFDENKVNIKYETETFTSMNPENCEQACLDGTITECECPKNIITSESISKTRSTECDKEDTEDEKSSTTESEHITTTITTEHADVVEETTIEPDRTTITTTSNVVEAHVGQTCSIIGNTPHESDCHSYYLCSLNPLTNRFELGLKKCPLGTAYSLELDRCARDLSACSDDDFNCTFSGPIPEFHRNDSYYLCIPHVTGVEGFYKFHIICPVGMVYNEFLEKCFYDFNNLNNLVGMVDEKASDEDVVSHELKEYKMIVKTALKTQKLKAKVEKKLEKELAKKAKKDAKAKLKANNETFVCTEEGQFGSNSDPAMYFMCISKKGQLSAIPMLCNVGQVFVPNEGSCVVPEVVGS
ncbi:uncharacterized protein LOC119675857 [Teleopsis dalmanni]|uniref:uncharacterized protein LOC119675140 n=1 Tax=Teleopsis dalmanni TaxID=139649 RepID=UPI0018CDD0AB|nr:uncharacterized protein LOC119675140 [Teleopsis dalmanni]XP_037943007.1 uncharacterized protein LOC119675857 [Teleopsis dalmanni]